MQQRDFEELVAGRIDGRMLRGGCLSGHRGEDQESPLLLLGQQMIGGRGSDACRGGRASEEAACDGVEGHTCTRTCTLSLFCLSWGKIYESVVPAAVLCSLCNTRRRHDDGDILCAVWVCKHVGLEQERGGAREFASTPRCI